MRALTTISVVMVLCGMMVGCWRKVPTDELAGLVPPEVLEKVGLEYYWNNSIPLGKKETVVKLYRLDENLYCLTNLNRLVALSAETGISKWSSNIADKSQTVFAPFHVDAVTLSEKVGGIGEILSTREPPVAKRFDAVVINTLSSLLVLDRSDGREVRNIPLNPAGSSAGAGNGRYVVIGTARGWYYAVRLQEAVQPWVLSTEKPISAPLKYLSGNVYVGSEDGSFHCVGVGDRPKRKWSQRTNGAITADFHVDERGCFVGSHDNRVYAFSPWVGTRLWEPFICRAPLQDPIQVGRSTVFAYARGDRFHAIDVATGRLRWSMPEGRRVLGIMGGDVYLLDKDKNLLIVNEMLGKVNNSLPLTGLDLFVGNTASPAIYAGTNGGRLVCMRLLEAGHLTVEMLKAHHP